MKTRNKLFVSVAALMVAIVAAASTTYAWFVMNNSVKLGEFGATVVSSQGTLLVAVTKKDGTAPSTNDYSTSLTANQLFTAINATWNVTKNDGVDATIQYTPLTVAAAGLATGGLVDEGGAAAAAKTYIAFDLYFKSDINQTVYLNTGSTVTGGNKTTTGVYTVPAALNGKSFGGTALVTGAEIDVNAANALRVGFVGTTANIWNPNFDKGYKGVESITPNGGGTAVTTNLAYAYNHVMYGKTMAAQIAETNAVTMNNANAVVTGATALLAVTPNTPTKLTVYLWLEGTDGECFGAIAAAHAVIAELSFCSFATVSGS